jgi:predicted ATPase
MSDGTIRALSMLVAIFDPTPSLVIIEEPENSLHPWATRVIVEACREACKNFAKQIILSTHSPVVLDAVDPDVVFVVWNEIDGTIANHLTELDPHARELWAEGESTLSDLVDSGYVRQAIPGAVL